jgi:hypothetical protein
MKVLEGQSVRIQSVSAAAAPVIEEADLITTFELARHIAAIRGNRTSRSCELHHRILLPGCYEPGKSSLVSTSNPGALRLIYLGNISL